MRISNSGRPSHVLAAMGLPEALARGAVRVSLGIGNTAAEVEAFGIALSEIAATTERR